MSKLKIAAALALSASALVLSVAAQDIAAEKAATSGSAVETATEDGEDVLVTARRRSEAAQKVPIALTVLSGEQLYRTGTFQVQRLTELVPSLQYFSFNPRNTTVNIRGLGNNVGLANDGLEAGVGVYIDEVYYSRPSVATFDLLDTGRFEVLRGPQGTLFGKNTSAGALNIVSRSPAFETEAEAEVTIGSQNFVQAKATVSGALVEDRLAGRLSISSTTRDGFIYNITTREDVNRLDNLAIRGQLLWQPSDEFSLRLTADYSRQNINCCLLVYTGVGTSLKPAAQQFPALAAGLGYVVPSTNPFDRRSDANDYAQADQDLGGAAAIANWDLGAVTLTSVTAWRYWNWEPANDADMIGLSLVRRSEYWDTENQYTQELRIASNGDRTVDYVAGVYAYHRDIDAWGITEYGSNATYWLVSPLLPPNLLDGYAATFVQNSTTDSYAVFGQLSWHVSPEITITPGLRYTYETKEASYSRVVSGGLVTGHAPTDAALNVYKLLVESPQSWSADTSEGSLSGQLNLAWQVDENILAYANYARGYKSGGLNLNGVPVDAANVPVVERAVIQPEETDAFEIGLKTQLFDRRLTANIALFHTTTRDYQTFVVDTVGGTLRQFIDNVDKVRSQGVELDLRLARTDGFSGYASLSYTDAKFVSYTNGPCPLELIGGAPVCDLSGASLPGVSRWSVSVGGEYATALADGEAYVGIDYSFRSAPASISYQTRTDAFGLVNLRLGYRADAGNWDAFVWARNLLDEEYLVFNSAQAGNSGYLHGLPGDPRTVGFTIRASY